MKCEECGKTIEEVIVYEETYKVYKYNKKTKEFNFIENQPSQNKIIFCKECSRPITDQLRDKL